MNFRKFSTSQGKLGRAYDLNSKFIKLHKQPGERDNPVPAKARPGLTSRWVGGTTQHSFERTTRLSPWFEDLPRRSLRVCNLSRVSDGLNSGMRIKQFQIPLWNLKREQHNSLHASAWYPKAHPKRPFPLAGPPAGSLFTR